jgi:serine protease Do
MNRWSLAIVGLVVGGVIGSFVAGPLLQGQSPAPPTIPKELTSYRDVVKKVLPAVVSLEAKAKPNRAKSDTALGYGSGFLVDAQGVILTSYHVIEGAERVEVELKDGRKFSSRDIKGDPKTDLAIIRIEAKGPLPFLELGDSDAMEIGDRVLAVGAPFGLTGSVTHGIVSGKGRSLQVNMYEDFLQTDAAINPGNSGGPLVNLEGKVIGINSAIKSRSGGFQGVGLAVASNLARNIMEQLIKEGTVRRGYLGVQIKDIVDRDLAARLGLKDQGGVLVTQVYSDSPGSKAGIQEGDVIVALAGKPIKDGRDLQQIVAGLPLGKPAEINVVRDGKPKTLSVTIAEQPRDFGSTHVPAPRLPQRDPEAIRLDMIGAEVVSLTPRLAELLGYKENATGAVILQLQEDGLAARAGLRRGMLIVKADKQPVKSAAELRDALNQASLVEGVLLQVQSLQGGTSYVLLKKG